MGAFRQCEGRKSLCLTVSFSLSFFFLSLSLSVTLSTVTESLEVPLPLRSGPFETDPDTRHVSNDCEESSVTGLSSTKFWEPRLAPVGHLVFTCLCVCLLWLGVALFGSAGLWLILGLFRRYLEHTPSCHPDEVRVDPSFHALLGSTCPSTLG